MIKYYWLCLSWFLLNSCTDHHAINSFNPSSVESFELKKIEGLDLIFRGRSLTGPVELNSGSLQTIVNWNTYKSNDDQVTISIPENWQIKQDSSTLLFCEIGKNKRSYFLFIVHNKSELEISIRDYKDLILEDIKSDSVERFTIQNLVSSQNRTKMVYHLNLSSFKKKFEKEYFSVFTENNNYILDFTMCVSDSDMNEFNQLVFNSVIFSIKFNDSYLFESTEHSLDIGIGIR